MMGCATSCDGSPTSGEGQQATGAAPTPPADGLLFAGCAQVRMDGTCELTASGQLTLYVPMRNPSVRTTHGKLITLSRTPAAEGTVLHIQCQMPPEPNAAIEVRSGEQRYLLPIAVDAYPPRLRAATEKWQDDPKTLVRTVDSIDPGANHVLAARLDVLRARALARLGLAQDAIERLNRASATLFEARRLSEAVEAKLEQIRLEIEVTRQFEEAREHLDRLAPAVTRVPSLQVEHAALHGLWALRHGDILQAKTRFAEAQAQATRLDQHHEVAIYVGLLGDLGVDEDASALPGCTQSLLALRRLDGNAASLDAASTAWQTMASQVVDMTRSQCQEPARLAAVYHYLMHAAVSTERHREVAAYLDDATRLLPPDSDVRLALTRYAMPLSSSTPATGRAERGLEDLARLAPDRFPWFRLARADSMRHSGNLEGARAIYAALAEERKRPARDPRIHLTPASLPFPSTLYDTRLRAGLAATGQQDAAARLEGIRAATPEPAMTTSEARSYWLTRDKAIEQAREALRGAGQP